MNITKMPKRDTAARVIAARFRCVAFVSWLILSVTGTIFLNPANAVLLQPQPRVCTELFDQNPVVFIGTVTGERRLMSGDHDPEHFYATSYSLDIQEVFVGDLTEKIEVITFNDSGRRTLDVGQIYLLFAHKSNEQFYIFGGGNSAEISEAVEAIQEIKRLISARKTAKTGSIRGQVYSVDNALERFSLT